MPRFADTQSISAESSAMSLSGGRRDAIFFVVTMLYIWISVAPFENLAAPPVPHAAANQLTGLVIALILGVFALRHRLTGLLLRPRLPILLLFAWLVICSVIGAGPGTSLQRLIFTALLCFITSVLVVMPRDRRQFDRMMAVFAIILLALCYFGVIFLRARAVHQPYDLEEKALAGDWRGIFNHKNVSRARHDHSFHGRALSAQRLVNGRRYCDHVAGGVLPLETNGKPPRCCCPSPSR